MPCVPGTLRPVFGFGASNGAFSAHVMRVIGMILLPAVLAVLVIATPSLAADVEVAVTGVSALATEGNGQPNLARTPDGTLFLIYAASTDDSDADRVVVARSDDSGETWVEEARLSRPEIRAGLATIAADVGGVVHAAWVDYETVGHVWYAVREEGAWSDGAKISPGPHYAGFPALAAAEDLVHVLWYSAPPDDDRRHGARYEIRHTTRTEGDWTDPFLISVGSLDALNPAAALGPDGAVHAAWFQIAQESYRAQHAVLERGKWTLPRAISAPDIDTIGVALAAAPDGSIHLVWQEGAGIQHAMQRDGIWSEPVSISASGAREPVVATDDVGGVFAAWSRDGRVETATYGQGDWQEPQSLGPGAHPTLLGGDEVRVAWTREAGEGYEIVFGVLEAFEASSFVLPVIAALIGLALLGGIIALRLRRR